MFRTAVAGLLALVSLSTPLLAQEQADLLPVEQAFRLRAEVGEAGRVALHWDIANDYYLYRARIGAKTKQAGLSLGALELPPGEPKHDEFLGDVEVYHHTVDATLPYTLDDTADSIDLVVTVQGCHETDPKICYPPHPTALTLRVPPTAGTAAPGATPFRLGSGEGGLLGRGGFGATDDEPLPAEKAFVFEAIAASPTEILARWTMPHGYYLYRDRSALRLVDADGDAVGAPVWPRGLDHSDEHFGTVVVYFDQVELPLPLRRDSGQARNVTLEAEFQGCKENGVCYPVMTRRVEVALPAASTEQLADAARSFVPAPPPVEAGSATTGDGTNQNALRSRPPEASALGLVAALLLALGGGLILNLMPCVLPVLSLKLLGLAQSGESAAKARRHALWYTAGVLVAFAVVGLLALALRAAGQALGWGFQLQQPGFVAVLVYLLFAVGLSLSGVFTIGAGLAGVGQGLAGRSGPAGDFFTGVLAVVVASPCTAPFMGPALAYAFAASPVLALPVFLALGLGLALPFLLVGYLPALAARLPRPGAWMDTLKQVLAFPMYLTAAWLTWVLGKQRGIDAVGWVLVGAIVLAFALWWLERSRYAGRPALRALAFAMLLAALAPLWMIRQLPPPATAPEAADAVAYAPERLAALRAEGRTVFVNMTADWCVTCKANEKAVLGTQAFRDRLKAADAVYMKGDWTNVDPQITAFLQEHQAVGVPLYVVFHGNTGNGTVLPTILTDAIVDAALVDATLAAPGR